MALQMQREESGDEVSDTHTAHNRAVIEAYAEHAQNTSSTSRRALSTNVSRGLGQTTVSFKLLCPGAWTDGQLITTMVRKLAASGHGSARISLSEGKLGVTAATAEESPVGPATSLRISASKRPATSPHADTARHADKRARLPDLVPSTDAVVPETESAEAPSAAATDLDFNQDAELHQGPASVLRQLDPRALTEQVYARGKMQTRPIIMKALDEMRGGVSRFVTLHPA